MAETPQAAHRPRPLSPFLTVYRWTPTMATSITHRVTGVGMAAGMAVIAWWLMAAASGPEVFNGFTGLASSVLGQIILFGFAWALAFHLLNGIRHLFWDVGYGFPPKAANQWSVLIIVLSLLIPAALFALAYAGFGGFYQ
jgi:succinate dehydrogenase / fumarate reductase cytochrome b subunit